MAHVFGSGNEKEMKKVYHVWKVTFVELRHVYTSLPSCFVSCGNK